MAAAAGARSALGFLTTVGGAAPLDAGAPAWFGPVGAGVGTVVGAAWWLGTEAWNPIVGAALAVAVDLAVTGLLHVDGLVDSADGLLPPLSPERRRAVMRDPAVGAFGVATLVAVLGLRGAALTALAPSVALCAALWMASRAVAAVTLGWVPLAAAAPGGPGLADRVAGGRVAAPLAGLAVAAVVAAVAASGPAAGAAAVTAVALAAGAVVALAVRRLGGVTGDVLGAAIVVGEGAGLLAAGVRL